MKNRSIILLAFAALVLCSCAGNFKDIRVTSCKLTSLKPSGLARIEARVEVGIDNPAAELHLTGIEGLASFKGEPCINLEADDIILKGRAEGKYDIVIRGQLNSDFNFVQLLGLIGDSQKLNDVTLDVSCRASLSNGLGKKIEYKDIPLGDIMGKL